MLAYTFYYWTVPFRDSSCERCWLGRAKHGTKSGDDQIQKLMKTRVDEMPVPSKGPPLLIDDRNGFAIAEMPAIIIYLGETPYPMLRTPSLRALTMKFVNDANDLIDEITLQGVSRCGQTDNGANSCRASRNGCPSGRKQGVGMGFT